MKILVTGGAGYIGSILVPLLLHRGYEVIVVDNFMYGQTSLLDCCHHKTLTVIRGDVRDAALMKRLIPQCDVLFPLACLTGAPLCDKDPITARQVVLEAVLDLIKWRSRRQKIIFPTTNSGYGVGEDGLHCTEASPLRPVSLYGRLKVEAEQALLDDGECVTLRLATAFGVSPRMRLDLLVNDFTYRAVTDGFIVLFEARFKRNYIHVRDAAVAFLHALDHFDTMKNEPYNVGLSDANLSKRELCEVIKKFVPNFYIHEAPIGQDPDRRNYIVSNAKIEATGYLPRYSLEDGIQELIKGYQIIRRNQFANV